MLIAVVGMDNTGKTTLVDHIHKELGIVKTRSPGPELSEEEKCKWTRDIVKTANSSFDMITDRFMPLEEIVYGKLLRGGVPESFQLDSDLMKHIQASSGLWVIYARPSIDHILNWKGREQMEGVVENAEALLKEYDHLAMELGSRGWPIMHYAYNIPFMTLDHMTDTIKEVLKG